MKKVFAITMVLVLAACGSTNPLGPQSCVQSPDTSAVVDVDRGITVTVVTYTCAKL